MSDERRSPRVAVRTLGCKVNRTESESLVEELMGTGFELVAEDDADVVVINTCTVTAEADAKARKAVRQALRAAAGPVVVVTGCLAAMDPEGLKGLHSRVVVEPDKPRLAAAVCEAVRPAAVGVRREFCRTGEPRSGEGSPSEACLSAGRPRSPAVQRRVLRTRATVKVQDGCDHRCTYCVVPDARGGPRSEAAADVVGRVAALVARGTREVVLTGINIGKYADAPAAPDFAALVEAVAGTGVERIRISSIEPADLSAGLLSTLGAARAVMPHLHVPLQSGCDRTLARMGRGYDGSGYSEALARARRALPGLAVTTDVIVGFPGETDEEFAESLAFVETCAFTRLHVFRYSPRPGTPAAEMPGRPDARVVAARAAAMRALGERLAAAYARSRVGGRARVLVERTGDDTASGTAEDYLRVTIRLADGSSRPSPGEVLEATITAAERGSAWGSLTEC